MRYIKTYENYEPNLDKLKELSKKLEELKKETKIEVFKELDKFFNYYNINILNIGYHFDIWNDSDKVINIRKDTKGYKVDTENYNNDSIEIYNIDTLTKILEFIKELTIEDIIFSTAIVNVYKAKELLKKHDFDLEIGINIENEQLPLIDNDLYLTYRYKNIDNVYNLVNIPDIQRKILNEYGKEGFDFLMDNKGNIKIDPKIKEEFSHLFDSDELGLL